MLKESLADVVGFSAAISSCEKGFQWQTALDLFQSLNERMELGHENPWKKWDLLGTSIMVNKMNKKMIPV